MSARKKRPLPPDPDGINESRAHWAENACLQFVICTGTDWSDVLQDLLTDLMHLCDRDPELDFARDLERARDHYLAETTEEDDRTRPSAAP